MARIRGTNRNDTLNGTDFRDRIDGRRGDDFIDGGAGRDRIDGGRGEDIIYGGAGRDRIDGGRDNDFIDGGEGDDRIDGGRGDDFIVGGAGRDRIEGGRGNDFIDGGEGDDRIDGDSGDDIIFGGDGDDRIDGGRGEDIIVGGEGDDRIDGGRNNDFIDGGEGDDRIEGGRGNDIINGGNGNDIIDGDSGDDIIFGGDGNDIIDGGRDDDIIGGGSGDDIIDGGSGDDIIDGGDGDDNIDAGSGNDTIFGSDGSDFIDGGRGTDTVFYSGSRDDYKIDQSGRNTTVQYYDEAGNWVTDTLRNVENLEFTGVPNTAPDAVADSLTVEEGVMVDVNGVLDNDVDPDAGDTLTVSSVEGTPIDPVTGTQITLASGAVLTMNADGTYSYDPNGAFNSLGQGESTTDSFTYTAMDTAGATDTATVTITIIGANDAPVAADDAGSVGEDGVYIVAADGVLANDSDPDANDVLSVSAVEGSAANVGAQITLASGALLQMDADGSCRYDPNGQFNDLAVGETATDTFTYTVSDGNGGTDTATATITINGANDTPTAADDDAGSVGEDDVLTVAANGVLSNDTDPDTSDVLSVSAVEGDAANVGVAVTLASGALLTMNADGSYSYDTNGAFEDLAIGDSTTDTFAYTVVDGNGGSDTATVTVTINGANDAPIAADDAVSANEDGATIVAANGVLSNDGDSDTGDTVSVSAVEGAVANLGAEITLASGALLTMNADGSYSYDPNGQFEGLAVGETATDSFSYTVTDSNGATDTATVTVTITGANDAPLAADDTGTVGEDDILAVTSNGVLTNDVDPDASDVLSVSSVEGTAVDGITGLVQVTLASGAVVTMNADGTYNYNTNGSFEGLAVGESATDSFTYTVSDGNGGTDTATVTLTIQGANDAPDAASDTNTVVEGGAIVVLAADGLLANDVDVDTGSSISVTEVAGMAIPAAGAVPVPLASGAILVMSADGSYTYLPMAGFNYLNDGETATDTFTYTVTDEHGATDTATVTITITGVGAPPNQAPIANDDTGSVGEDGLLSVAANGVLSNDTDPDAGDVLSVSAVEGAAANVGVAVTLASGALLTMNADGSYSYDPNGQFEALNDGQTATDTFTYTVDDGNGGTDTATVTVTINGATDNSAPTAIDDTLTVDEGVMVAVNGVLDNDVDPDPGDTLTVTHVNGSTTNVGAQVTLPSGALLTMQADGTYTYDPNGAFNSLALGETTTDSFSYTATDSFGATDTATLTITINGANDAPVSADDAGSVAEGSTLVVAANGVLSNDSDPDATDVLSVSAVEGLAANVGVAATLASGALVTMNADGSYSYDPNGQFNGLAAGETATDSFTYAIDDGNGGTDTATVTVTINGANDAPVAVDDAGSVGEDGTLVVAANGVLSNDSDPNADVLSVSAVEGSAANVGVAVALASGALVTMNADGSYSYDPNGQFNSLAAGETATDTFTYAVDDGNGGTDTATVTVTINGANDGPAAAADTGLVGEDGTLIVAANGVLSNDSDPDATDVLSVSAVEGLAANVGVAVTLASGALLTMNADGSYSYDTNGQFNSLAAGETATDTFTYSVDDGNGGTDTATVTVTVNGANDGPTAVADAGSVGEDGTLVVAANGVLSNDSDPDATDVLSVSAVEGAAANVGVAVTLASGALLTMNADGSYSYDPNGQFEALNDGETATDTFTYAVDDGNGGTDTATVTVTINGSTDNTVPNAIDDALTVDEDLSVLANSVLDNDIDPDLGDTLAVTHLNGSTADIGVQVALPSGALLTMNADGTYSYDPNGQFNSLAAGETATDSFTYTATDSFGATDTATVTVTINGANDGPTAGADAGSVAEDGTLVVAANGVLSNDSDPDATDVLSVSAVEGLAANVGVAVTLASGALVTMNADGSYSYDPNGQFNGLAAGETATDTFTYAVDDGNGGTDTATVTVTINGANDGPTAANDTGSVGEDGTLVVAANGVLSNDSDPDATDVLSVSAVEGLAANVGVAVTLASGALVTMNADGSYSYDTNGQFNSLAAGETATDTFTYAIDDGNGGTDTATVTVTINGANDAPVAANDTGSVGEDGTLVVAANGVLSNDSDPDATDVLSVSAVEGLAANVGVAVTLASGALVTMNADGSYSYDPNGQFNSLAAGETATDTFTYSVDDGNGGTDTATVTVTINGANDGPVAANDTGSVGEDGTLVVAANGVLSNDSDPDASDVLSVSAVEGLAANVGVAVTLASGALVTMNADGSYSYDPNGQFNSLAVGESATDTFTYAIDDGNGGTDTASVTVTINGANDAPVAANDTGSVGEDGTLIVAANGVLSNDSDPDASDVLSVSAVEGLAANVGVAVTLASGALVTMNADGSYSYDPNGQFNGLAAGETATDTFTYAVDDGNGGTDTATVTVTISGANDGPVAADDTATVGEDGTLVVAANGVLSNDSDPDASDVLSVSAVEGLAANVGVAVTLASGALVTMNADGSYSYDPNGQFNSLAAGETATDTFTYAVDDGNGGTDTATVTVTINGANDGPTAANDTGSVFEDGTLVVAANGVLSNDSDPDTSDVLNVSAVEGLAANVGVAVTLASGALVTMNADGSYSYDTNGAFNGLAAGAVATDTFTYAVSDGNGGTDTATVTVAVIGANDGPTAVNDTGAVGEDGTLVVAANGVLSNDSDPDATDVLSVSAVEGAAANVGVAVTLASGALVTMNADGSYSYDPNGQFNSLAAGETATDTFTYSVDDGNGGIDTATVTVTVNGANDGPTAANDTGSVGEDGTLVVAANGVLSNDSDPDATDVLSVSAVEGLAANVGVAVTLASGALLTMNANGSYSYDPNGQFDGLSAGQTATDTFTYAIDDGNGGTDTATVTVTINGANDGPTAANDTGSVGEDGTLVVAANGVLSNDSDADAGDVLSVSAVEGLAANVGVAVTLASGALLTMNADGSYSYDPNGQFNSLAAGETATDSFTYAVSDGNGGTDTATVTVTINGANDGPTAANDTGAVGEDGTLVVAANGVLSNDSDPDATDVLSVSSVEGLAANVGVAVTLASGALVTMNANGSYSYDPNGQFDSLSAGQTATDTFTYAVDDGNGGTDTATVTVTISGANDGPTAVADAGSIGEDGTLVVAANGVLSNDSDPDAGDVLTVSAVEGLAANVGAAVTLASGALLTMNADGSYSYDTNGAFNSLAAGATATDTFTYVVSDGNGGTDTATVTVTVNGANDGPVAGADTGAVDEDMVLNVAANGVLANDSDPDAGDTFSITAVEGLAANIGAPVTLASGALLTMNADGSYSYDPNGAYDALLGGQTDTDTFTYTVTDSQGATDTATVTVTVTGTNALPIAGDDAATTTEDAPLSVSAVSGVLANDSDPDGDPLTISAVEGSAANIGVQITLASGALLTLNADGSYDYDPNGAYDSLAVGQTGTDTFTYTVDDANGGTATATVTVTLTGANDGPVAVNDLFVVDNNSPTTIASPTFLDNDFDPDTGDTITLLTINGQTVDFSSGEMFIALANGDELYVYDDFSVEYNVVGSGAENLAFGQSMTESITYTIQDSQGVTSTGTMNFVIADNDISIQDLDGTNGFTIRGAAAQDLAGQSVSSIGDVNGDGIDDFVVGAIYADPNAVANAGTSYVVFGNTSGFGTSFGLSTLDGSNGFAIEGATAGEFTGASVSGAGDINGDGFADVIIGARDNGGNGSAYVVFGSGAGFGASVNLGTMTAAQGFTVTGIDTSFSDITVSAAGDFNGDGIGDVIIGSQGADPGGVVNAGQSYVVFGQAGGFGTTLDVSAPDGTNGFTVSGSGTNDNAGFAVSAGDLNNDGYDDLVVGGFLADPNGVSNAGEVYVVYGGAGVQPANIDVSTIDGTNGFVISGAEANAEAGRSISSIGDLNGDGIDDLVIGAPASGADLGGAYVVFGQDGNLGANMDLGSLDGTNGFQIVGSAENGQAGLSVASAGDVNGDGFEDIIIGAPAASGAYDYYGNPVFNAGEAYLVFGSSAGFDASINLNQLDGSNGFVINGMAEADAALGTAVSSAGDINGDGFDDLLIGAPKVNAQGNDSGGAYVLYGQDFQGNVTHQGTAAGDTLTGDVGANVMIGGQGDDFLSGAGGLDVLYGGLGNDTLAISDLAPQRIDGGSGEDVLQIDGANLAIDLGSLPVSGIETVDITGSGDNILSLSVMDVLDASDTTNVLKVLGDLGDQVIAEGGWASAGQQLDNGVLFDVYTAGQATLMVDSDLNNNVVIV